MNSTTLKWLGAIVIALAIALLAIESGDDGSTGAGGEVLPELRDSANDIERLTISRAGTDDVVVERRDGEWRVPSRGDYAADVAHVRDVLLAMTNATIVEAKTANPDLHDRLGVDTPLTELSKGTIVTAIAGEDRYEMVFGNVAQGNYRYARRGDDDQSWLIDQNPDIPGDAGEWLLADIVDIDGEQVQSVTISHADGETIAIRKETEDDANFEVADVPEGRELSYSTVANGIGGALNDLDLDDVRPAVDAEVAVTTSFETFDGAAITVASVEDGGATWIALAVEAPETDSAEWQSIADRVAGWQYRIADYKANLLKRRWDDILKAPPEDEGAEE